MKEPSWLAEHFEAHRSRLHAVAFRMLGSLAEADDAVQETWLRLSRAQTGQVENLGGWLTTVAARVCLDILRARAARKEELLDPAHISAIPDPSRRVDPEDEALTADAVGLALLVVLDRLTPAERIAFVLHDISTCRSPKSPASLGAALSPPRSSQAGHAPESAAGPFTTLT